MDAITLFFFQKKLLQNVFFFCRVVKFSSVNHLTLHFPCNFGSDKTRIYYIGLRGEYTSTYRHGVTICTYEARPNVADHKIESINPVTHQIQ